MSGFYQMKGITRISIYSVQYKRYCILGENIAQKFPVSPLKTVIKPIKQPEK